jgi:hypothetical protein
MKLAMALNVLHVLTAFLLISGVVGRGLTLMRRGREEITA